MYVNKNIQKSWDLCIKVEEMMSCLKKEIIKI